MALEGDLKRAKELLDELDQAGVTPEEAVANQKAKVMDEQRKLAELAALVGLRITPKPEPKPKAERKPRRRRSDAGRPRRKKAEPAVQQVESVPSDGVPGGESS